MIKLIYHLRILLAKEKQNISINVTDSNQLEYGCNAQLLTEIVAAVNCLT